MRIYWGVGEWRGEGGLDAESTKTFQSSHIISLMCPEETSQKRNILFNNDSDASFCAECNRYYVGSLNFDDSNGIALDLWSILAFSNATYVYVDRLHRVLFFGDVYLLTLLGMWENRKIVQKCVLAPLSRYERWYHQTPKILDMDGHSFDSQHPHIWW